MISVIILTKNEDDNIEKSIKSVRWCNEIIVVDDESTDDTLEKVRKFTLKIFKRKLNNNFSSQRNFGLSRAKYDWVLFVDADEVVGSELKNEILKKINKNKTADGFYFKRKDFIFGNEIQHGEFGNIKLLRLAKKGKGRWMGNVHEKWEIRGKIDELKNPLFHFPHQSINEFLREINFYTDIRAKELFDEGAKSDFLSIILYTKIKFIQNYLIKFGFLDGTSGLVLALLMSFHSFLVRSKLWLLWQRK